MFSRAFFLMLRQPENFTQKFLRTKKPQLQAGAVICKSQILSIVNNPYIQPVTNRFRYLPHPELSTDSNMHLYGSKCKLG